MQFIKWLSSRVSLCLKKPALSARLKTPRANPLTSFREESWLRTARSNPAKNCLDRERKYALRLIPKRFALHMKQQIEIYRTIAWTDPKDKEAINCAIRKFKWNSDEGSFISLTRKASRNSCSSWCWSVGAAVLAPPILLTISTNSSKLTFPSPEEKS